MAQAPQVGVIGLKALARDIKAAGEAGGPLLTAMREAARQAADPVAARARASVPRVSGDLAGSIRVTATRTGSAVRMGSAKYPYAGPVDFGGYPGDRQYIASGQYLFPAAGGLAGAVEAGYERSLTQAFDTFAWTNRTTDPGTVRD